MLYSPEAGATAGSVPEHQGQISRSHPNRLGLVLAIIAVGVGVGIRLLATTSANFPLGDGGLFYVMATELASHRLALPAYTSYNHAQIPFAYPPLGLYVAATLHNLTSISMTHILLWVPALVTCLSLLAFWLLASRVLSSRWAQAAAVLAFAILPDAFYSEASGGGITRAFGQLFGLLAVYWVLRCLDKGYSLRRSAVGSVLFSLTALSHPEWILFAAYSSVIAWAVLSRRLRDAGYLAASGLGAVVLAAPWWIAVARMHGLGTLAAPMFNAPDVFPRYAGVFQMLTFQWATENGVQWATALAAIGFAVCAARGRWLLPIWLIAIFLLEPRAASLRGVILVSLLAGEGSFFLLGTISQLAPRGRRRAALAVGVVLIAFAFLGAIAGTMVWESAFLTPLPASTRSAMSWTQTHTPPTARFAVVTSSIWAADNISEWFPALSGRTSVATVQGYEWLGNKFRRQDSIDTALQRCGLNRAACLADVARSYKVSFDYVFIMKAPTRVTVHLSGAVHADDTFRSNCCASLISSLNADRRFVPAFNGPGAIVYRVTRRFVGSQYGVTS